LVALKQAALLQHIDQGNTGGRVQLMFPFLEFQQDGAGPTAIGTFCKTNCGHFSLLVQKPAE